MNTNEMTAIYLVDYQTDSAVVHEYMSSADFQALAENEASGRIIILNHRSL